MEVTVEHGKMELLHPGAETAHDTVGDLYLLWRENGSYSAAFLQHCEVELLQPGAEAGQETVDELYLWWRENGSDSGAW